MVTKTKTEYKTVEEQRQITACDNCGISEDEDAKFVNVAINPQYQAQEELEVIQTFDDMEKAVTWKGEVERRGVVDVLKSGVVSKMKTRSASCSASADLCANCLTEIFDTEVDIPEEAEIDDIKVDDGKVSVWATTEKKTYLNRNHGRESKFWIFITIFFAPFITLEGIFNTSLWDKYNKETLALIVCLSGFLWGMAFSLLL